MTPEREIVNLWLNKRGFFTVSGINAGSRVIDFIAVKSLGGHQVMHVEVTCSVSSSLLSDSDRNELFRLFNDRNVVQAVESYIENFLGAEVPYEKVLVTNFQNVRLADVSVVRFEDVLFDIINGLDKQRYKSQTIRTMQILKFLLMADPVRMSALLTTPSPHRAMSSSSKEALIKELLAKEAGRRVFRKQSSEQLLMELLKESSLRQPDKLAKALEEILTKRSGSRLLNELLKQKGVKAAIREELGKDRKLEQYFMV